MKLSFRIRRIYFDAIKAGVKDCEVRRKNPFWDVRVAHAWEEFLMNQTVEAVLVCGKEVLRKECYKITEHPDPVSALGGEPSEQGWKDIGDGPVYKFHLR